MLEFEDDLICGVTFCGTLLKTPTEDNYKCKDYRPSNPYYDIDDLNV